MNPRPSAAGRPLIVDGRMLFSSGIGRYLREILRRKPDSDEFRILCNSAEQQAWVRAHLPAGKCVMTTMPLYSWREQLAARNFPPEATYWVPHYNVPRWCSCRLVATVHDVAPLALPELFGGRLRQWAARFYFKSLRERAHRLITVSQFTRGELESRGLPGTPPIAVVPNGVSAFWFAAEPKSKPKPGRRLLCVGNLKPHKNLGRLLEAMVLVRQKSAVQLDIVGRMEGFRTGLSRELLEQLHSTPWIRVLGEVSDEALRRLYHEAQALVFPSLYEGFGLPLLEAMAAGCPVLSSDAGALAEVSGRSREHGGAVDYFDPRDPRDMAAAIGRHGRLSPDERSRIELEGRRIASAYSWERTAAATWAVLNARDEA